MWRRRLSLPLLLHHVHHVRGTNLFFASHTILLYKLKLVHSCSWSKRFIIAVLFWSMPLVELTEWHYARASASFSISKVSPRWIWNITHIEIQAITLKCDVDKPEQFSAASWAVISCKTVRSANFYSWYVFTLLPISSVEMDLIFSRYSIWVCPISSSENKTLVSFCTALNSLAYRWVNSRQQSQISLKFIQSCTLVWSHNAANPSTKPTRETRNILIASSNNYFLKWLI